jgi:hypothetical protein
MWEKFVEDVDKASTYADALNSFDMLWRQQPPLSLVEIQEFLTLWGA